MIESDNFKNYLHDLGVLIKELAIQAKMNKNASINSPNADYDLGYLMAMHQIVALMQQQAYIFAIQQEDIGLSDIDPEADLL